MWKDTTVATEPKIVFWNLLQDSGQAKDKLFLQFQVYVSFISIHNIFFCIEIGDLQLGSPLVQPMLTHCSVVSCFCRELFAPIKATQRPPSVTWLSKDGMFWRAARSLFWPVWSMERKEKPDPNLLQDLVRCKDTFEDVHTSRFKARSGYVADQSGAVRLRVPSSFWRE